MVLPGIEHITLLDICVTVPATLAGTIALSLYSLRRGKEPFMTRNIGNVVCGSYFGVSVF